MSEGKCDRCGWPRCAPEGYRPQLEEWTSASGNVYHLCPKCAAAVWFQHMDCFDATKDPRPDADVRSPRPAEESGWWPLLVEWYSVPVPFWMFLLCYGAVCVALALLSRR